MGAIRLTGGIEIPNGDMATKTDGAGEVGAPDGYTLTPQLNTDIAAGLAAVRWEPATLDSTLTGASPYGTGRCLSLSLNKNATSNLLRYVTFPLTRLGQMIGDEAIGKDEYKVRLRFWFHGIATVAPATGDFYISLITTDASGGNTRTVQSYNIVGTDFDLGQNTKPWMVRQSFLMTLNTTSVKYDRIMLILVAKQLTNGAANSVATAQISNVTLESLTGLDTGVGPNTLDTRSPNQLGYYQLSKNPLYKPMTPTVPRGLGKQSTSPNGTQRYSDASRGVRKRTWAFEHAFLTRTDVEKLWRLWNYNKGYATDSGTFYGNPQPLVLMPNQPDEVSAVTDGTQYPCKAYYVNFADETFPVPNYDGAWQQPTESQQVYRAMLRFVER